jgi:pyrroline-5-carboxylate reductase
MRVGFIGAGQMGTALARGLVQAKIVPTTGLIASDPNPMARQAFARQLPEATVTDDNCHVVQKADVVVLAVKPGHIDEVMSELAPVLTPQTLVISIAAGVPLVRLAARLCTEARLVRVMPNTPCLIGQGAAAYSLGDHATASDGELVNRFFSAVGQAHQVPEKLLDAVTGLSGSGPAFVYTVIEALSDAGVLMGLPRPLAAALALQTVRGSAELAHQSGEHPSLLRDQVTSPGGTTAAGLEALEKGSLRATLLAAVRAATERSRQLGQETH